MPTNRASRRVSLSSSCSVSGKTTSTSLSVAGTAYPRHYDYYTYPLDDSTVSDGRTSHTYSHCCSVSGSSRLSRSHSARSLRTSEGTKSRNSSKKHSHKNYYDCYDYHDDEENIDTHLRQNKIDFTSHSPVYSVALRDVTRHHYDDRHCTYVSSTATTATRTVRKQFDDCGHDQIAMAIRCAQRSEEIVRAFARAVDMHRYTMSVNVPKEGKATVTETEYCRVPKKQQKKKKKKVVVRKRTCNTPLHDLLYANGRGSAAVMQQHNATYYREYDEYEYVSDSDEEDEHEHETQAYRVKKSIPALVEDIVPGTVTYVCNSGWTRPAAHGYHRSTAEKLIHALPHFSFHWSGGEFMIGSLRAAIDREARHITISAPTLMSRLGDVYGVEDIGMKGIRNFFYWNSGSDNSMGRRFEKPTHVKMYYDATPKNIARC